MNRAGQRILSAALALGGALAAPGAARAEARPSILVTPGAAQSLRVAVQEFAEGSQPPFRTQPGRFRSQLSAALEFSGEFEMVDPRAFLGPVATAGPLDDEEVLQDCDAWRQIGADALVDGRLTAGPDQFGAEFRVWDTTRCRRLLRKRYRQSAGDDPGLIARRIADDIAAAFLGTPGVASTEIAFISDRSGNPEVYVMDADGANPRSATSNRSINSFPSWNPGGDSIVYTSYRHLNRPMLFLSARGPDSIPGLLLPGLGSGRQQYRGVFEPSGERMAVVMVEDGPPEIYTVRGDGRGLRRLTRNQSIDISPSWSPDGSALAFVSDRSGSPQVYVMDTDGGNVRRLTYNGDYNSNPAWSPDGRWIAYDTRVEGQFDIWLIDPDGGVNVPLVTHPRSDEAPSWAPNGRKLAFSSTRRGRADIYVVDVSGSNLRRITQNAGDNSSPAWGAFPR